MPRLHKSCRSPRKGPGAHAQAPAERGSWNYVEDAPLEGAERWAKARSHVDLVKRLIDLENQYHDARIRAEGAEAKLSRVAPLYDAIVAVMRAELQPMIVEALKTSLYVPQEPRT